MCEAFNRQLLRLAIAQICQSMGWDCIHKSTHEVLTNILQKYLEEIAKTTKVYSELFCRTEPTLDDLGSAFSDLGVFLHELEDYVSQVDPNPFVRAVVQVPIHRDQQLNHPSQEEIRNRPEVYYDYLPLFIEPKEEKPEEPVDKQEESVTAAVAEEVKMETPELLSPVRQDIRAVKRSRESYSPVLPDSKRTKFERTDSPVIKPEDADVNEGNARSLPRDLRSSTPVLERPFSELGESKPQTINSKTSVKNPPDSNAENVSNPPISLTPTASPITSPRITSPVKISASPVHKKPASPRITSPKAAQVNTKLVSPTKKKVPLSPRTSPGSSFTVKKIISPPLQVKSPPFTPTNTDKQSPPQVPSPHQIKSPTVLPVEGNILASTSKAKVTKPSVEDENSLTLSPTFTLKPLKNEPKGASETQVPKKPAKKQKKQKPKNKDEKVKETKEPITLAINPTPPVIITSAVPTVTVPKMSPLSSPRSVWTHEEDSPTELTIDLSAKPKGSKKKKKKESEGKTKKKDKTSKSKHAKPADTTLTQAPIPKIKFKLEPVGPQIAGESRSRAPTLERTVKTETLYNKEIPGTSDKVYYCPACSLPDDGSPMIGCDGCDEWFHWPCAGITSDPGEKAKWYCRACQMKKMKKKKKKKDKVRDKSKLL